MNAIEAINQFVDVMLDSKTAFENIKAEAEQQNKAVEECIARFREDMSRLKSKVDVRDSGLRELSQKQIATLEEMLKTVGGKLEAVRRDMQFIKEYEDSFNIAVFGKVKAGKSYTGNFIMGNGLRDFGIHTSYDKISRPTVKVIDRGKVSERASLAEFEDDSRKIQHDQTGAEAFFVDPNEATSTIQLFRLGGMVWIDTPGIGSITEANEILAKDFVDNADLIVYMSNSDAGGTKQDFEEVKALYGKRKRFLFLLTQSDTTDEDCDDDGNIIAVLAPKKDADRKSMEDHICNTLIESGINDFNRGREVLTISTKLALEGLRTNDEAMFDASNLKRFFEVLVSITKNEAAKIKLATPAGRINAMIDDVIKELRKAKTKLSEHMKILSDTRERLTERSEAVQAKMLNDCIKSVTEKITNAAQSIESGNGASGVNVDEIVAEELSRVIMGACKEEFAGSEDILSGYTDSLKVGGISGLSMRQDTISYEWKETYSKERDPDGIWENIKSWFGTKYYTTGTRTHTKTQTIDLGVNLQQVLQEVRAGIDAIFAEKVPEILRRICDSFIAPVSKMRDNADKGIESAIRELEGLKIKA